MEGIFNFYKPKNKTSYDIIRTLKKKFPSKKIGHGGTLDPIARGVLVVAIGRENTKKLHQVLKKNKKEYIAKILLGLESNTYDITGKIKKNNIQNWPRKKDILQALENFKGEILQKPPIFSAVKVSGVPAYNLARRGKNLNLKSKKVFVFEIKLLSFKKRKDIAELRIKMLVSSGFYVRSFANDLGRAFKTGAVLKDLIRTKVGSFSIHQSISFENI